MKKTIIALAAATAALITANGQVFLSNITDTSGVLGSDTITITAQNSAFRDALGQTSNTIFSSASPFSGIAGVSQTTDDNIGVFSFADTTAGTSYTFDFGAGLSQDIFFHFNAADNAFRTTADLGFSNGSLQTSQTSTVGNANSGGGSVLITAGTTEFTFTRNTGAGDNYFGTFATVAIPEPSSALLLGLSALGFIGRRKR